MLGKEKNHRSDHRLVKKIAVFGMLTIVSGALFVFGLVQNGNGAVERYEVLIAVDQAGGDVEGALNELRSYIYSHMNSEIGGPNGIYPPIQLSGTYDRLVAAEEKRVEQTNDDLYSEAQSFCEVNGSQGFSGSNRLDCINAYVDENGAKAAPIDESFYKYDFVAPRWSADLAGFSLLFFAVFAFLTSLYGFMYLHTRHLVRSGN